MPIEQTEKEKEIEEARKAAMNSDEELKDIEEEVRMYGDAEAFSKSEGGKKLVKSLEIDVLDAVILISSKYKTASHIELISWCASLESKMDLLRRITQSSRKKDEAIKSFNDRLKKVLGELD